MRTTVVLVSVLLAMAGCNQSKAEERKQAPVPTATPEPPKIETPPAPPPLAADTAPAGDVIELKIESVAENMTFNLTSLTVPTGRRVHIVLKNNAKSPLMPHNWMVVRTGTEAAVALAGLNAGKDAQYVPKSDDVIAATPLAPPGGTAELTFTAPAPGVYPYICTVPGHYMLMKGKLTVTP